MEQLLLEELLQHLRQRQRCWEGQMEVLSGEKANGPGRAEGVHWMSNVFMEDAWSTRDWGNQAGARAAQDADTAPEREGRDVASATSVKSGSCFGWDASRCYALGLAAAVLQGR